MLVFPATWCLVAIFLCTSDALNEYPASISSSCGACCRGLCAAGYEGEAGKCCGSDNQTPYCCPASGSSTYGDTNCVRNSTSTKFYCSQVEISPSPYPVSAQSPRRPSLGLLPFTILIVSCGTLCLCCIGYVGRRYSKHEDDMEIDLPRPSFDEEAIPRLELEKVPQNYFTKPQPIVKTFDLGEGQPMPFAHELDPQPHADLGAKGPRPSREGLRICTPEQNSSIPAIPISLAQLQQYPLSVPVDMVDSPSGSSQSSGFGDMAYVAPSEYTSRSGSSYMSEANTLSNEEIRDMATTTIC